MQMKLADEVYSSFEKYFRELQYTGYKSYNEVNSLLIFSFIEEILYGPLSQYVTYEDYKYLSDAIYYLYGTCLIPFPTYRDSYTPVKTVVLDQFRVTENGILRCTEESNLRTKV